MKTMSSGAKKCFQITSVVILIFAIAMQAHNIAHEEGFFQVMSEVTVIALIGAVVYSLYGFKKNEAKYYKLFINLCAVATILRLVVHVSSNGTIRAVLTAVQFGALCVLSQAKDLGRKKSMILGLIFIVITLAIAVSMISVVGFETRVLFMSLSDFILALVINILLLAKYADKAERGTT